MRVHAIVNRRTKALLKTRETRLVSKSLDEICEENADAGESKPNWPWHSVEGSGKHDLFVGRAAA
jgi:hypothetical protein